MRTTVLVFLFALLSAASSARAEFYTWTDRDGKQFYTNDREKIPAEHRASARSVEMREERVSIDPRSAASTSSVVPPAEHKDRHGRGEDYWRRRAENLRRQIRDQQFERDALVKHDREEERAGRKPAKSRSKTQSARDKKRAKIEKKIDRLRHELDVELPEEARKADALPGWLR